MADSVTVSMPWCERVDNVIIKLSDHLSLRRKLSPHANFSWIAVTGHFIRYMCSAACLQISNQPISWQQLNAFRLVYMVKMTSWSSSWASAWRRKGDLREFECDMVVGARGAGMSISEFADPHNRLLHREQQFCEQLSLFVDARG